MRVLYIDIDSLRADHLGCYGYHRPTSPNIDALAADGVRFENLYISDAPCMPSRTALFGGRFGIHNGVVNHGGTASQPFVEGPERGFESMLGKTSWMRTLRDIGYHTATVSPFAERHSAWHWYANFNEVHNTGKKGMERADEVAEVVLDWLGRRGADGDDRWFLHVNLWDPHTPYRCPDDFGEPFAGHPLPAWYTEDVRAEHWSQPGPHSAQEVNGYDHESTTFDGDFPRQPVVIDSMDAARAMFDGYDAGTLYADLCIGKIFQKLRDLGLWDQTVILIGADHGENLGELNIYGDHQTADQITCRVPLVVRWPGITDGRGGSVDRGLHYHLDFAATLTALLGGKVPGNWDGRPFDRAFAEGAESGREYLVVSQGAWCAQRGVRFEAAGKSWIYLLTYHDAYHGYDEKMLFNLTDDPHEQRNLSRSEPDLARHGQSLLEQWHRQMMQTAEGRPDPMETVIEEGGPLHAQIDLSAYLKRLRETGRAAWADRLAAQYGV
ncbi:MAG: sulfatase [Phycisphaeraceae bacterium]|nr:sulfatase [Phycisphaeraceae bacterium]